MIRIDQAVAAVRRVTSLTPPVAVILGSGLSESIDVDSDRVAIPYRKIPRWPAAVVEGHPGTLVVGRIGDTAVALAKGRSHYYEGWRMEDLAFPVRVLAALGAHTIVITAAAGSLRPSLRPGSIVALTDHINLMGANPLRGAHEESLGPRFVSMEGTYDPILLRLAMRVARKERLPLKEGVYVAMSGPTFETPAEVRMLRELGGDVVGMSVVPEAVAARQAGLRVLGLALVANLGAGMTRRPLSHAETIEAAGRALPRFAPFIRRLIVELATAG